MPIFQFTGLSGAGKTTLAKATFKALSEKGIEVEIIDGDQYRKTLCADLGFSRADREENIRRLAAVANKLNTSGKIVLISAINPFESIRNLLKENMGAKIIWIKCSIHVLIKRDTKGLYKRAMLPDSHPDKITNLTGINDIYEDPQNADLILNTASDSINSCADNLSSFILSQFESLR